MSACGWLCRCFVFSKLKVCGNQALSEDLSSKVFFNLYLYFLGLQVRDMEVPRLGIELELQLLAYTSHSNSGSQLHPQPTPQLMAIP